MATGTITWLNASKGHAFITPDEGGQDLFVEPPGGSGPTLLFAGAAVDFDVRPGVEGRIAATNVALREPEAGRNGRASRTDGRAEIRDPEHPERTAEQRFAIGEETVREVEEREELMPMEGANAPTRSIGRK
jgi:cold shock CspA family protein